MKILIVDDELKARNLLKGMLLDIFSEKENEVTLFYANCLKKAVSSIRKNQPEIVLLDIEMPENSGLEIIDFFKDEPINFQLIFTTAYSDYAIEAFKLNAIDYLLKPIDIVELERAIRKAKTKSFGSIQNKIEELRKTFLDLKTTKIILEVPNGLMFVSPKDIEVLVADGMYTTVYLKDGNKTLIARSLKYFVEQLEKYNYFYKPHRSYYINLNYLKEFSKKEGNTIVLENGMSIPIARDKKEEFIYIINQVF